MSVSPSSRRILPGPNATKCRRFPSSRNQLPRHLGRSCRIADIPSGLLLRGDGGGSKGRSDWFRDRSPSSGGGGAPKRKEQPRALRKISTPVCPDRPMLRARSGSAQRKRAFQRQLPPNSGHDGGRSCCRWELRSRPRRHASDNAVCRAPQAIGTGSRCGSGLRNAVSGQGVISRGPSNRSP